MAHNLIPIGIDLGTTYSVVAAVSASGNVDVIRNDAGGEKTPSVVLFEDSRSIVVGDDAKEAITFTPDRVVSAIKRHMGERHPLEFDGVEWGPEAISALVLTALADAASAELGVQKSRLGVVVTVPAYFGIGEREATSQAAEIAGLHLLELIPEPQAAALFHSPNATPGENVLVFDLGGGTFDTTLLQFTAKGPQCVVVDGHSSLGGIDWDARLAELLRSKFLAATELDEYDLDDDFEEGLASQAEALKTALTTRASHSVMLRSGRSSARVSVSRAEFEEACTVLVDECARVVERTLAEGAARGISRVDGVVLVGGSTRMPMIPSFLEQRFGIPARIAEPDLAVVKGAALHAWSLCGRPGGGSGLVSRAVPNKLVTTNVLPRGLGVVYYDSADPEGLTKRIHFLVRKHDRLPITDAEATFATILDGQKTVRVELYEQLGEEMSDRLDHNRKVFDGEISGLGNLPGGSPITLSISIDAVGLITDIKAVEKRSGRPLTIRAFLEGVADSAQVSSDKEAVSMLSVTT
ncbi:hypothetical protein AYJ66_05535 [Dietzia cinnamea]|nr:hypothetical protein AYJ66_05535 [Dietzia cinnamea]